MKIIKLSILILLILISCKEKKNPIKPSIYFSNTKNNCDCFQVVAEFKNIGNTPVYFFSPNISLLLDSAKYTSPLEFSVKGLKHIKDSIVIYEDFPAKHENNRKQLWSATRDIYLKVDPDNYSEKSYLSSTPIFMIFLKPNEVYSISFVIDELLSKKSKKHNYVFYTTRIVDPKNTRMINYHKKMLPSKFKGYKLIGLDPKEPPIDTVSICFDNRN